MTHSGWYACVVVSDINIDMVLVTVVSILVKYMVCFALETFAYTSFYAVLVDISYPNPTSDTNQIEFFRGYLWHRIYFSSVRYS